MENKFFTFLDPILGLIDDGAFFRKPFRWLYTLLAALNLLVPIGVLVAAIDNHVFNAGGKFVVAFIGGSSRRARCGRPPRGRRRCFRFRAGAKPRSLRRTPRP